MVTSWQWMKMTKVSVLESVNAWWPRPPRLCTSRASSGTLECSQTAESVCADAGTAIVELRAETAALLPATDRCLYRYS
jgi:hypothetical protein